MSNLLRTLFGLSGIEFQHIFLGSELDADFTSGRFAFRIWRVCWRTPADASANKL